MKHLVPLVTALVLLAACGPTDAGSGGPLTLPEQSTTTTAVGTDTTPPPSTPAPTTSVNPGGPTTTVGSTTTVPTSATTVPTTSRKVTVYFINSDLSAVPVTRTVTTSSVARAVVEAIIAGPTQSESAAGLVTSMPPGSLLLGLTISDGVAVVDLSREAEAGGGSSAITTRLAQLVYSLTEFDSVDSVQILIDGQHRETFSGEGYLIDDPLTAGEFSSAVPKLQEGPTADAPTWTAAELPVVAPDDPDGRIVALVADDDTLNVRSGPGVSSTVIGRLVPGVSVTVAGQTQVVGNWPWVTIDTPVGPGWVNSFYLSEFARSTHFLDCLVNDLRIRLGGSPADCDAVTPGTKLSDIVSERGLWVVHHADPIRFALDEVDGLLDDPETYRWGSNALGPDSDEIRPRTFRQAIADRFVGSFESDTQTRLGEPIEGPNGRPASAAVPAYFENLPYVSVFDPGDDPQYGGLDWTGWIVSFTVENGELKVVGLTIDEWAP